MQITVVITTHDRPELLHEAIASVEAQRFDEWDVIVVDDGSCPAVMLDPAQSGRVRLLRNETAQGPSEARNTGMRAATGEVIFFLDDDDLLDVDALVRIDAAFQDEASLNCLFVNVEPFGSEAEGTLHNQTQAMTRVLSTMDVCLKNTEGVLCLDSNRLFGALLDRVPMAFQRVAIKRVQLQKVGLYSGKGFEDLEWYYRVALRCTCGLLVTPSYRVRCEGQSYFSRPEEKQRLIDTIIRMRKGLLNLDEVAATPLLKSLTIASLASANFNKAYYAHENNQPFPWRNLLDSAANGLCWQHFSLAGKALKNQMWKMLGRRQER